MGARRPGAAASTEVLGRRALNRATLHRQLLLARSTTAVREAVERIGGLNAQHANDPYLALHSRLAGFRLADLTAAIEDRRLVRSCLLRATQHLVSATDFRWLRPVLNPLLARVQRNAFGRRTAGVDLDDLVADARAILAGRTLTRAELGRLLAQHRPDADRTALAWSVQYLLPLLHPAPSGTWDTLGATPVVLAEEHLGPLGPADPRRLVSRYLAAFGPATTADMRAWSGVSGLREIVADMAGELRTFRDETGRTVYDLPDAPRPDPDTPAPVRLLAGFDNLLLAHADRTRIMTDEIRRRVCVGDLIKPTVLVDGMVSGTWHLDRRAGLITVEPFTRLGPGDTEAVTAEGHRVLRLAAPDAAPHSVQVARASAT
ncbi:winged helix DNA-binding domain-containing protein [Micromonospora purpureochromogenes]|uniref:winged helix DNA-binding domain-containing protein n=1 Tax=Micromonospora purpureochromogenes TaxID=47872 RepID=UPI0033ED8394